MRPGPKPSPLLEIWLSDTLDGVATVVIVGLVVENLVGSQGAPRILLALAFLLFVPGRAVTANWDRLELRSQVTVSMLFSVVILALLATVTLWLHYWHPIGLMQAEAGLSLLGLAMAAARRHWFRRGDRPVTRDSQAGSNDGVTSSQAGLEMLMMMSRASSETPARQGEATRPGGEQTSLYSPGNATMTGHTDPPEFPH